MKYKNINGKLLDMLDNLPSREVSRDPDRWSYHRRSDYHRVNGYFPHDRITRILKCYIGRPFDEAFSYYCKISPKYQQHIFLEEFKRSYRYWKASWEVDESGNIVHATDIKKRHPVMIFSDDYKLEWKHKVTGHLMSAFKEIKEKTKFGTYISYGSIIGYEYGTDKWRPMPLHLRYTASKDDFEAVIVSGWRQILESTNDPRYIRHHAEKQKLRKKNRKLEKIAKREKQYSFLSQTELQKKKDKALDRIKIVSHGFDLETSFRTEKQWNPDLIKR